MDHFMILSFVFHWTRGYFVSCIVVSFAIVYVFILSCGIGISATYNLSKYYIHAIYPIECDVFYVFP
jgi:hypothetical protein